MIDAKLSRTEINRRVGRIVRCFKWAVENEKVPATVHHGLKAVTGLKKGRTTAHELEPVKPVPEAHVEAVRPFVSRQVWAMIELQRLTGMHRRRSIGGDLDIRSREPQDRASRPGEDDLPRPACPGGRQAVAAGRSDCLPV
jgi:hypothetical protein